MFFKREMLVVVVIATLVADIGQAAILDPMTAMRDDISRIKVMMETVGGKKKKEFFSLNFFKCQ